MGAGGTWGPRETITRTVTVLEAQAHQWTRSSATRFAHTHRAIAPKVRTATPHSSGILSAGASGENSTSANAAMVSDRVA
jgi:hypothetical protein